MNKIDLLKTYLSNLNAEFWSELRLATKTTNDFQELLMLATLKKRAIAKLATVDTENLPVLRIAIMGSYSLYPLRELFEQYLFGAGYTAQLWIGEYDNYTSEILDETSGLYDFRPEIVIILPAAWKLAYRGELADSRNIIEMQLNADCNQLISFAEKVHQKTGADILFGNLIPPKGYDLGPFRSKTLGSPWSYITRLNLDLGLASPSYMHICDVSLISARLGLESGHDPRSWFESKQLGSSKMLVYVAQELARMVVSLREPMKKVLVLDLDNTLWGGVIGDDGIDGIELGDTSPRGEAFKAFQKYILSLSKRGILLAVCSKNDQEKALEPFISHPEMVLKVPHIACFMANWMPKSENIKTIAKELNLGLDSFVFVDDNPAEIEIVNQFLPQVRTILLSEDPSSYIGQLEDSHYFEPMSITKEDFSRTNQYIQQTHYKELESSITDMDSFLHSLEMRATISEFTQSDAPRISQLINKSNQFNLTTKRRSESEVLLLINSKKHLHFSIRLADKFGDHGLISIIICNIDDEQNLHIDTWLMSCRVLKRQVEEEALNEIVRIAKLNGFKKIFGKYIRSPKNSMVACHYEKLGFTAINDDNIEACFALDTLEYIPKVTHITTIGRAHDANADN